MVSPKATAALINQNAILTEQINNEEVMSGQKNFFHDVVVKSPLKSKLLSEIFNPQTKALNSDLDHIVGQ